jgi:endoglucanase
MYALVDFHILSENPKKYTNHAIRYFTAIAKANKNRNNIIYEIANEPTKASWNDIRSYAERVIPEIRKIDPDAVIIVGTRDWSSFGLAF